MRQWTMRGHALVVAAGLGASVLARAADGDLDPTFAGDGLASTTWPDSMYGARIVPGPGGSVFVAFTRAIDTDAGANLNFSIAKFRSNGTLDPTFGSGGLRTVGFDRVPEGDDLLLGAFATTDGGLMLAGYVALDPEPLTYAAPGLLKLTATGALDTTFGAGGRAVMTTGHFAGGDDDLRWKAVAREADGTVVFAGDCFDCDGEHRVVAVRLAANGALDTGFGVQGWFDVVTPIKLGGVAFDAAGRVVLAGSNSQRPWFARLTSGGGLDPTFGTGGVAWWAPIPTFDNQWIARGMILQRDGAILLALGNGAGALVRATATGERDPGFGDDGFRSLELEQGTDIASVAVGSDRRIVFAGTIHHTGGDFDQFIGRLLPNGEFDDDFDDNGVLRINAVPGEDDFADAVALVDGRPLIAGVGGHDSETTVLIRLRNDRIFTDDFAL